MEEPSNKKEKWIWLSVLLGVLLLAILSNLQYSLELTLLGEERIQLEYGESYTEPGVAASVDYGFLKGFAPKNLKIQTESDLQEDVLGRYHVRYSADYLGLHGEVLREIQVIDTQSPVIVLAEDSEELQPDGEYLESGFSAWDNYDGDITERVVRTELPRMIRYAVTDSSGNPAVCVREVPLQNRFIVPEILLEGGTTYTIAVGSQYEEPGFLAADPRDGDLTEQVVVEGEVDWLTAGTYPVTYTVSNSLENTTVATRNVQVVPQVRPDTCYPEGKTVYLTFDDGPSPHTERLLDILDKYDVKATFFVLGTGDGRIMKDITERGHTIGIHSVSHVYSQIYSSPQAFFEDLLQTQQRILDNTGVKTTLMRFPGGSSNMVSRKSCPGIMTLLTETVQDAGFQFFDWNVYSGDAGATKKTEKVVENVIEGIRQQPVSIVLQHDIHGFSVDAVEEILLWGQENGYTFLPLSYNSPGFHHDLNN